MSPSRAVIPHLPDLVLRKVFAYIEQFGYGDLCRLEVVCKRWARTIQAILRKDIQEIVIERAFNNEAFAYQQIPFRRLCVRTPPNPELSIAFLSGILRRSRLSIGKLTCDIAVLAMIDTINCRREANRKYFSNVEELWLLVAAGSPELCESFQRVEGDLFTNLSHLTLQLHVNHVESEQMENVIKAFVDRFEGLEVHLELHADSASKIFTHLRRFGHRPFSKVKLICTDLDPNLFSLSKLAELLVDASITIDNLTIRDWRVTCDPGTPLVHFPMNTLRISSCEITNVDALVSAIRTTFRNFPFCARQTKKATRAQTASSLNVSAEDPGKPERIPIERLELAGQCRLTPLEFLETKAHEEFQKRVFANVPSIVVNCDDIYFEE